MSVRFLKHIALQIPSADQHKAIQFYSDFGLEQGVCQEGLLSFGCKGRRYQSLYLIPGANRKKIHHISMGASEEGVAKVRGNVLSQGLELLDSPPLFSTSGIWFRSPQGFLFHVDVCQEEGELKPEAPFLINSPGYYNRVNKGQLPPKSAIPPIVPRKLGHALLFTPDIFESIEFLESVLGMRLSDRSEDVSAFLHCPGGSDHHVLALATSPGIGFHHMSFMVGTPDEVGLGGSRMIDKGYVKGWGFGRHAIGSNFFHYIRDPWGSFAEYYADIDYIADSDSWVATNWPVEDSLHTWGPNPTEEIMHNPEVD